MASLIFLSCLYGSERRERLQLATHNFLSCLYGSERHVGRYLILYGFLSCLYGSELDQNPINLPSSKGSSAKARKNPLFATISNPLI